MSKTFLFPCARNFTPYWQVLVGSRNAFCVFWWASIINYSLLLLLH